MHTWTMKEIHLILQLEQQGYSQEEIAQRMKLKRSQVYSALRRHRPVRWKQSRLEDHREEIARLHSKGLHNAAIIRQTGLSEWAIYHWIARLGLTPNREPFGTRGALRPAGGKARSIMALSAGLRLGWPGATEAEARVLTRLWVHDGATRFQVAAELGVSCGTIHNHLRSLRQKGMIELATRKGSRGGRAFWRVIVEPCDTALPKLLALKEGRMSG